MTTCRPDIAFTSVKLSQSNSAPAEHHYHGLKHAIHYVYITRDNGIYFWRTTPHMDLPNGPLLPVNSNHNDFLLNNRPDHDATIAVAYGDSDWATCAKTCRSFSGICIQLAGGTIAYKTKFQPTVALSSMEAEFMASCNVGCMSLFIRSVLWDLDIPQEAATIAYKDNDGCTAMGNAQKPTARTRHIDIKYFALCDWVEPDLLQLERTDTSINISNHSTKLSLGSSFTGTPIFYLDISLRNTHWCTITPSQHTQTIMRITTGTPQNHSTTGTSLNHLQPPRQLPQRRSLHHIWLTSEATRGSGSCGIPSTIQNHISDCGGGVSIYVDIKVLRPHFYSYPIMPTP
jgi:hypothetical protein